MSDTTPNPNTITASIPNTVKKDNTQIEKDRGNERYAAYMARMRQIQIAMINSAAAASRYLAYSSDVGESLRPVVKPIWVTFTYGVAWTYVIGDCSYQAYKEKKRGENDTVAFRTFISQFAFQAIASMLLPMVIIHTAVHQAIKVFESEKVIKRLGAKGLKIGPSVIGIGIIPFLPLLDHPIEHICQYGFDTVWPIERLNKKKEH